MYLCMHINTYKYALENLAQVRTYVCTYRHALHRMRIRSFPGKVTCLVSSSAIMHPTDQTSAVRNGIECAVYTYICVYCMKATSLGVYVHTYLLVLL